MAKGIEWKQMSDEALVEHALAEYPQGELHRTSAVIDALLLQGCTISDTELKRRFVNLAVEMEHKQPEMVDDHYKVWRGTQWVGAPTDRMWDRHGWRLPLWLQ